MNDKTDRNQTENLALNIATPRFVNSYEHYIAEEL